MLLILAWLYNPSVVSLLAAAASTTDDPLLFLLNFGTLGVWVICSITGLQPTRGEVKRMDAEIGRLTAAIERLEEKDRSKDQAVAALVNLMSSRTLPTLATAVSEIPAQSDPALGQRLESLLSRIEQGLGDDRKPT